MIFKKKYLELLLKDFFDRLIFSTLFIMLNKIATGKSTWKDFVNKTSNSDLTLALNSSSEVLEFTFK